MVTLVNGNIGHISGDHIDGDGDVGAGDDIQFVFAWSHKRKS